MQLSFDIECCQGQHVLLAAADFSGRALGIFGSSGSGKTTLLRVLAGLQRPQRGRISLDGDVLFDSRTGVCVPAYRRNIGLVFQDTRLFPHWSTERNLRAGMASGADRGVSFDHVVQLLELGSLVKRPVTNLSGGEKQRVALGRALLASPRLLLMDEPLSGLDAGLKQQIMPFLLRVQHELKLPYVFVSHDLSDTLQLTEQLVVLEQGRILGQGTVDQLMENREVFYVLRRSGLSSAVAVDGREPRETVRIRPDAVMLATHRMEGLSARYQRRGTITRMIDHGELVVCMVDVAGDRLLADLTPGAVRELGLHSGSDVWCLFKSLACEVRGPVPTEGFSRGYQSPAPCAAHGPD